MTDKNIELEATAESQKSGLFHCLLIHPNIKNDRIGERDTQSKLNELIGLATAIDLNIRISKVINLSLLKPSTFFGKGVVNKIKFLAISNDIKIIVIDNILTPVQQRNLERFLNCKVIDRTGLILEIFGRRARTSEGRIQVGLAALTYQRSRLVRSWTHLERQRGGAGFMGGPGETQIESDRRQIDQRITRLRQELKNVKRTRDLHRKSRRKVPYPIIALIGYTNAGKSTLFNKLTDSKVKAEDQLFATLDPTMRSLKLHSGRSIIISDTVGFISDLPHELVTAFHATLEEVTEANIIIHVRDAAHLDTKAQNSDVLKVLSELNQYYSKDRLKGENIVSGKQSYIEVLNKIDCVDDDKAQVLYKKSERSISNIIPISALTGEGCDNLLNLIDEVISKSTKLHNIILKSSDGASISWLYENGEVIDRKDDELGVKLKVRLDGVNWARFKRRR